MDVVYYQEPSNPPSQSNYVPSNVDKSPYYPSQQLNPLVPPGDSQVYPGSPTSQYGHPNFPPQGPITNQPIGQGDAIWQQRLPAMPNCPPGLEYLASIDHLLVHQKLEVAEVYTDVEIENKYSIHNSSGQMVYHASEESGSCMRNYCGSARALEMIITDNLGQEVIHLKRLCRGQGCLCFCCLQKMEVYSPPGIMIATIHENVHPFKQSFTLKDPSGNKILRIIGSCCWLTQNVDIDFEIFFVNSDLPIGKITKKWSGFFIENYTNVDSFEISFPKDLDVKMKAILLGALFLIDMMFFEYKKITELRNPISSLSR